MCEDQHISQVFMLAGASLFGFPKVLSVEHLHNWEIMDRRFHLLARGTFAHRN
jgi:hypothetical protein